MNCQEARKWISPYLDSELGNTKTFEVSEHLRNCPQCEARFERERQADGLVLSRLEVAEMPGELWNRVQRDVFTPWWVRRLRSRAALAMAACLGIVFVGSAIFELGATAPNSPPILGEFLAMSPDDEPFALQADRIDLDINEVLSSVLPVPVALTAAPPDAVPHRLEVVEFLTRADQDGRKYTEVRLNCCGQPLLLVLAEPTGGRWPAAFGDLPRRDGAVPDVIDGVNIAAQDLGDVMAVAVSRHPVAGLVGRLHRQGA